MTVLEFQTFLGIKQWQTQSDALFLNEMGPDAKRWAWEEKEWLRGARYHPDKNLADSAEATELFQLLQREKTWFLDA